MSRRAPCRHLRLLCIHILDFIHEPRHLLDHPVAPLVIFYDTRFDTVRLCNDFIETGERFRIEFRDIAPATVFAKCVDKVIDSTVIWTRNVDCRDVGGTVHDMDLSGNLIEVLCTPGHTFLDVCDRHII